MSKAIEEIRGTDSNELKARLSDLRKETFELRFHGSDGANPARARAVRRTIARILTVLGDRERQEQKAGGQN